MLIRLWRSVINPITMLGNIRTNKISYKLNFRNLNLCYPDLLTRTYMRHKCQTSALDWTSRWWVGIKAQSELHKKYSFQDGLAERLHIPDGDSIQGWLVRAACLWKSYRERNMISFAGILSSVYYFSVELLTAERQLRVTSERFIKAPARFSPTRLIKRVKEL